MTDPLDLLVARIGGLRPLGRRALVAVAGAPASGKSTLAADLVARLGARAALVPMDGFHLDNRVLDTRGLRARKGAPETFDAAGFVHLVRRLAAEPEVVVPVFDRAADLAVAGAGVVGPDCDVAVVEGNYLLLDTAPWAELAALWDLTVYLDVAEEQLVARSVARWLHHGHDRAAAEARARGNDLANARIVAAHSRRADIVLK